MGLLSRLFSNVLNPDEGFDDFSFNDVSAATNFGSGSFDSGLLANGSGVNLTSEGPRSGSSTSNGTSSGPPANAVFASIPTLATYLVSGYWAYSGYDGTQPRHWASNTISVNINGLSAGEQTLALGALSVWAHVANVFFTLTNGSANITYNDNGGNTYVANTSDTVAVSGQNYQAETIDISNYWFTHDGGAQDGLSGYNSYDFQTYIHETGHALGLGHEGPYNNTATYGVNNIYTNDTWQWSIMSYNSQDNFGGASYDYVVSPEMADIYAIQQIYGANTSFQSGNTYGFNANTGAIFDFSTYAGQRTPAFTIYDTGSNNTLDASGYSQNQIIDLNPGHWSSIGGSVDNIGISTTSNIENAVGGSGNDLIIPNGSLIGTLTGGGGNDTFQGTTNGLNLYTITDLNVGDQINFTNANVSTLGATRTGQGSTISYNGGSIHASNDPVGHFIQVTDSTYGGVDLIVRPHDAGLMDFSGDGSTDMLWFNSGGQLAYWNMNGGVIDPSKSGSVTYNGSVVDVGANYSYLGTGDFFGWGKSDVLWQNSNGQLAMWSMNGDAIDTANSGSVTYNGSVVGVSSNWKYLGAGDFTGDGSDNVLWRDASSGQVAYWDLQGKALQAATSGLVTYNGSVVGISSTYSYLDTGHFYGPTDSHEDVLWQNNNGQLAMWRMNGNTIDAANSGSVTYAGSVVAIGSSYSYLGHGDFYGAGSDDMLWRNSDGTIAMWDMNGRAIDPNQSGNVLYNGSTVAIGADWHFKGTGDLHDNGTYNIIWQNDNGQVAQWMMSGRNLVAASSGLVTYNGSAVAVNSQYTFLHS